MGAITAAIIAIAGIALGWITIEIACKPCLEQGRQAIDRNLNPDYDPDDDIQTVRAPLNPNPNPPPKKLQDDEDDDAAATSRVVV